MTDNWKEYFEHTKDYPPRGLLQKALPFVNNKGVALDLGSGALNDSVYLLENDFDYVVALDKENIAQEIAETLPLDKFEYVIKSFEEYEFPENKFDLINAQYALPFINPSQFDDVFKKIEDSLRDGGIFVGQFFGTKDEWSGNKEMTFQTRKEARKLLSSFEILTFKEKEQDKETVSGDPKHWHIFHFIVRKI